MNTQSVVDSLLRTFAITLVLAAPIALGQTVISENAPEAQGEAASATAQVVVQDDTPDYARELPSAHVTSSHEILAYNRAIKEAESREGAYGSSLSETMLGLAQTLQAQGRHEEAIKHYKRGIHLARINEGLYCQQQIPMLQGEIASHKAMQNYAEADERQNYLYRVQSTAFDSSAALVAALMDQAKWQYEAYQLRLGENDYERLINMWELYRVAFSDVVTREGETSPSLLAPLHGMLQAQYLISSYEIPASTPVFDEDGYVDEGLLRFKAYYHQSYKQGNAVIEAISAIKKENNASDRASDAQALVMLGDWRLWNGKTDAALTAYREATRELASEAGAKEQAQRLFGEPVALPDIAGLQLLPPVVAPNEAAVTVAFGVNEYGRVRDLQRLDDNEADDRQAYRLMRKLRKATFRPRFEAGQPVETQNIVKAFDIQ